MEIKILSFNIHKGLSWNNQQYTLHRIKQFIRNTDVDLAFLQEISGENIKHKDSFEEACTESQFEYLASEVWPYYAYSKNAVYDHGHHGNAILSKFPINEYEKLDISTNRFEQRGLLYAKVHIPHLQRDVHCFCVHLNLLHSGRVAQYQKLIDKIQSLNIQDEMIVLAGDFNDWNQAAHSYLSKELDLVECHKSIHQDYAKSYPSRFAFLKLDRVYVKNVDILEAKVLKTREWMNLSDHLPLNVKINLR